MIYNNEKFKTHIEGLDMLLFGGLCLHKSCTEHTLTVVIQGEEGTYKSLLAMQLMIGLTRSMKALEKRQNKQDHLPTESSIELGKSIFYSQTKSEDNLHDLLLDLLISQGEEKVIKEGLTDKTKWKGSEFCKAFFSMDSSFQSPSFDTRNLDEYLVNGLLYYNVRTNSLNLKKTSSLDEDVIVYKRKFDRIEGYYTSKEIPDCLQELIPDVELLTSKQEPKNPHITRPCLVIQGINNFYFPKALVTIHILNSNEDSLALNPDVIIRTRVTSTHTKYEIRQLSIRKCALQATANGWHQYKKRSTGIMVFPTVYVLTHKRDFQSSFYRRTQKDILQQTFSQYVSTIEKTEQSTDYLYNEYTQTSDCRDLKTLENLYNYSQKGDKVRMVLQKILFKDLVKTGYGEKKEAQLIAIIGKANNYKRFLASAGSFHESICRKGHTLKVLLNKDGQIILRRMICPALIGMNNKIVNLERLKKCRECYKNIHFMNVDIRCTTSDEFFYYLLKQLEVIYPDGNKITRVVIDDLQRIDHSFSQIKGNQSFLPDLKDICKDKNVNVCVLCDEDATMAHQLSVLADNVLLVKRTGFNSLRIYISRYSGHNQPNLIYACQISDMDNLFKCETENTGQSFSINELLIQPIEDFNQLSTYF